MKDLKYTNEFLKALEPIIVKHNLSKLEKIKKILAKIAQNEIEKTPLQNLKTYENNEIYRVKINEKETIFWTEKDSSKIVIALIKV